jgi:PPOX class probable F420-dependent enzyme
MEISNALTYAREHSRGVLVTIKSDGRPQLSNVLYAVSDDGVINISVTANRAKTVNARRDPRVSLHITAEDFWSYVVLEGNAELGPIARMLDDEGAEEMVAYYRSLRGEHPDWDEYRRVQVEEQRQVLRIRPTHVYGMLPSA